MVPFTQWIERLATVATTPALFGLVLALAAVLIPRRWYVQVLGMALMYGTVGVLHASVIRPEVVLVKLLVGAVVCLALAVTGWEMVRPVNGGERPGRWQSRSRFPFRLADDTPLRGLALVAAFLIAYAGSLRFPLPQVQFVVGLSCYLMAVVGLFLVGMSEEPLPVGLGLLVFLNGFDLFFGALEPSLVVAGLLGMVELLITLSVAYLALARGAEREET